MGGRPMAEWFVAPSLLRLRAQVDQVWPQRDRSSDGTIGDPSHAAAVSSHNPCWRCPGRLRGVVRGMDLDNDGDPGQQTPLVTDVKDAAIGDPRVWYVIWNRRIYSRTYGWQARVYTGANPHDRHLHISLREDTEAAVFDTADWLTRKTPTKPPLVDLSNVRNQFLIAAGTQKGPRIGLPGVKRIQRALNADYGAGLKVDGLVGRQTLEAWARHEARLGGSGRPRIPDRHSLTALARGRFRVVP